MKGLDCLVNNASIFENDNLNNFSEKSFLKHINVNLKAPAILIQNFAKACKGMEKKEQMKFLAQAFMSSRETGESEAYYRIFPHLQLSKSNLKCKFVSTGFPSNRFQFARKV